MKVFSKNNIDVVVYIYLAVLLFFIFVNLSNTFLWQDEAESVLNSLTIGSDNIIPKAYVKNDLPMHECALYFPKENDPVYDYYPTAYYYSSYVTLHGWVPYYFIKWGMDLFGENEFGARFFSPVFFILFLALLYKLLRINQNFVMSFLPIIYISLMSNVLTYAMQARYFAYMLFFLVLSTYFFIEYCKCAKTSYLIGFIIAEVLLYYTYLQLFYLTILVFAVVLLIKKRNLLSKYVLVSIIGFIFVIPHIIFTKVFLLAASLPKEDDCIEKAWPLLKDILNGNNILIIFFVVFALLAFSVILWNIIKRNDKKDLPCFSLLSVLFVLIGYFTISYISPQMTFYQRIFLPLVPFIVYGAINAFSLFKNKYFTTISGIIVFVIILCNPVNYENTFPKIKDLLNKRFMPTGIAKTDSSWVEGIIEYINKTDANNPLVLTSFEHFVFGFYSGYDVQLIWPVKKEYLDSTDRDLIIILEDDYLLNQHSSIFYPEEKREYYNNPKNRNYYDIIQKCSKKKIGNVTVYELIDRQ